MTQYRYLTRFRRGKWYNSILGAQTYASRIGAGFLDPTGNFIAYRGTILELREIDIETLPLDIGQDLET